MNHTTNQLKIGTILSYVTIAVQNLISILYTPFMLRMLGRNEYGLFQLGNSTVAYLGLLSLGFGSSYVRFYYKYKVSGDEDGIRKLNGMFLLVFSLMAIVCIVVGASMIYTADYVFANGLTPQEIKRVQLLMIFMVLSLALTFPNIIFDCYITAHEKYIFQRILLIAVTVLNPVLSLPLLLLGCQAMSLVVANLILSLMRVGLNIYYCFYKLNMKIKFQGIQKEVLKSVGTFSFFIFLNEIVNQINWNVDKLILGAVKGSAIVSIYSVGSQFNQYFINMSVAVSNVFIPRVNRMVAEKESDRNLSDLFIRIGRIQYIILGMILIGYLLYGEFFITHWAGKEYKQSYIIGAIIMIPSLIPLIQNIGIEIQRAKNKHKFRSIVYFFIALGNLIISIPLAIRFGAIGSSVGTALATILGNIILMNWYYEKQIHLDIKRFFFSLVKPTCALGVAAFGGIVLKSFVGMGSWIDFCIQGMFFVGIYFICLFKFGFHSEDRAMALQMIRKIIKSRK